MQPAHERLVRLGRLAELGGLDAQRVDALAEHGVEQRMTGGEVAVERADPHAGSPGDLLE